MRWRAQACVDGPRVVIAPRVGLGPTQEPFGCARQPVEVRVANDGIDRTDALDQLGRNHLRASAVLGFGREHKSRVDFELGLKVVIMMVDPRSQPRAKLLDQRPGDLFEPACRGIRGKRQVHHHHPSAQIGCVRKLAGGRKYQLCFRNRLALLHALAKRIVYEDGSLGGLA